MTDGNGIDHLTEKGADALARGDRAGAEAAFAAREVAAKIDEAAAEVEAEREREQREDLAPEPETRDLREIPAEEWQALNAAQATEAMLWQAESELSTTPEGRATIESLGDDWEKAVGLGNAGVEAMQQMCPELVAAADDLLRTNATIAPALFQLAVNLGMLATGHRPGISTKEETQTILVFHQDPTRRTRPLAGL